MSACFWVQYFNAQTTLVISKDTDMLLLLGLVCPSGPKKLFLRLDYKSTTDYVDMLAFKQWMGARFGSYYDGFLYVTMQVRPAAPRPAALAPARAEAGPLRRGTIT